MSPPVAGVGLALPQLPRRSLPQYKFFVLRRLENDAMTERAPDDLSALAVAVERLRREHAGALPETLQQLVPAYLAAIPADPFTGTPLLYRRTDSDFVIYSVGQNLRDDGGDLTLVNERTSKGTFRRYGPDVGARIFIR